MRVLAFGKKCPKCRSRVKHRIRRLEWMHLIPKSKMYSCNECYSEYIYILGLITILVSRSKIDKAYYRRGKERRSNWDRRHHTDPNFSDQERRNGTDRRIKDDRRAPAFSM